MKKMVFATMMVLLLSLLCACGTSSIPDATPEGEHMPDAPEQVKIAVMIPGSPTDGGFCQQGAEAGAALNEKHGYEVKVLEVSNSEVMKQEAENLAAEGYKIVFGQGGQYATPFAEVAEDYPNTYFVTLGGNVVTDNVFPVCINGEETTYVLGVIAGMMSQTGKMGVTLSGDFPAYAKTANGFTLGVKSVNPDAEVMLTILSAADSNEGYEATMNQIQAGADMIISNSNEAQAGALKAVKENPGVYAFACLGDFFSYAPGQIIASYMGDYPQSYEIATQAILEGALGEPHIMFLGLSDNATYPEWNDEVKDTLPAEVIAAAEKAIQDIKDGKIEIPNEYELDG